MSAVVFPTFHCAANFRFFFWIEHLNYSKLRMRKIGNFQLFFFSLPILSLGIRLFFT